MTQTLLTFYCIGATFAILPLAFALRQAWQRIDSATNIIAFRDGRVASLVSEIDALKRALDRRAEQVAELLADPPLPCEPPPGCVGATATSRAQREDLRTMHAHAAKAPWRITLDDHEDSDDYLILGEGNVLSAIGYVPADRDNSYGNARLLCEARNMAPDLLDDVETLLGDVERLQIGMAQVIAERDAAQAQARTALAIARLPADGGGS